MKRFVVAVFVFTTLWAVAVDCDCRTWELYGTPKICEIGVDPGPYNVYYCSHDLQIKVYANGAVMIIQKIQGTDDLDLVFRGVRYDLNSSNPVCIMNVEGSEEGVVHTLHFESTWYKKDGRIMKPAVKIWFMSGPETCHGWTEVVPED